MFNEGPIRWLQDLNASTATTAYPTSLTAGVKKDDLMTGGIGAGRTAAKLWVMVDYRDTVGATSCCIGVYGLADQGVFASTAAPLWTFIGALNKGSPIAATGVGGFQISALRVASTESLPVCIDNFTRFATRSLVPAGTAPTVSTFIGVSYV
jgi:hypothetical protein